MALEQVLMGVYFLMAVSFAYSYWEFCYHQYRISYPYTATILGLFWPLVLLFAVAYMQSRMSNDH